MAGVIAGSLVGNHTVPQRRAAILVLVAALLALAAVSAAGAPDLATIPMGAENAVFADHGGEVRIRLTYMTGTLVKLGQRHGRWPFAVTVAALMVVMIIAF